jgi:hypothetical protein
MTNHVKKICFDVVRLKMKSFCQISARTPLQQQQQQQQQVLLEDQQLSSS